MRFFAKAVLTIFLATTVISGGLVVLANTEIAHNWLEKNLSAALARDTQFEDLSVQVGTTPVIELTGLTIASPSWATDPVFMSVKRARLSIDPRGLLQSPIHLQRLELDTPILHLESRNDGESNWVFDTPKESHTEQTVDNSHPRLPVITDSLVVQNLAITLRTPDARTRLLKVDVEQAITPESVNIVVNGSLNDSSIDLKVNISPLEELLALRATQIAFEGKLGEIVSTGNIALSDLMTPRRPTVEFMLQGPSIEYLTDRLGFTQFSQGPMHFKVSVQPDGERMAVKFDGQAGQINGNLIGAFDDLSTLQHGEATAIIYGASTAEIGTLLEQPGLPDVPFSIAGRLIRNGQKVELEDSRIKVGKLTIDAHGDIPDISHPTQANLDADISTPALERLASAVDLGVPLQGSASSQITIQTGPNNASVSANFSSHYGHINLTGSLQRDHDIAESLFTLDANGDGFQALLELTPALASALAPKDSKVSGVLAGPWQLSTKLALDNEQVRLSEGKFELGEDQIKFDGSLPLDNPLEGSRMTMSAELASPHHYLAPFTAADVLSMVPDEHLTLSYLAELNNGQLSIADLNLSLAGLLGTGGTQIDLDNLETTASFLLTSDNPSQWLPSSLLPHEFNAATLQQPLKLQGILNYQDNSVGVTISELSLGKTTAQGSILTHLEQTLIDIDVNLQSPDLLMFASEEIEFGAGEKLPISAAVVMKVQPDRLDIDELHVTGNDGTVIRAAGDLRYGETFDGTDFTVELDITSLRRVGALAGVEFPETPLSFKAALSGDTQRVSAKDFVLTSGDSHLTGDFRATNPEHPNIQLQLQSELLDLRPFMRPLGASVDAEVASEKPTKQARAKRRVIPDQAIDLSPLATFDADIDVDIAQLITHRRRLHSVSMRAAVHDGGVVIEHATASDEDNGTLVLDGFARPQGTQSQIAFNVAGNNINLGYPATTQQEVEALPRLNMQSVFYGSGANLRDLVKAGTGFLQVDSQEGLVPEIKAGFLTNDFIAELIALVNPFKEKQKYTAVQCSALVASIEKGEVRGDPLLALVTDHLAILANAKINLSDETLFASFNTVPQKGLGISATSALNPFIGVGGTLAEPQITMDPQGTLVQGGLAVVTGGLSIVGKNLLDRVTTDHKSCAKAAEKNAQFRARVKASYLELL